MVSVRVRYWRVRVRLIRNPPAVQPVLYPMYWTSNSPFFCLLIWFQFSCYVFVCNIWLPFHSGRKCMVLSGLWSCKAVFQSSWSHKHKSSPWCLPELPGPSIMLLSKLLMRPATKHIWQSGTVHWGHPLHCPSVAIAHLCDNARSANQQEDSASLLGQFVPCPSCHSSQWQGLLEHTGIWSLQAKLKSLICWKLMQS